MTRDHHFLREQDRSLVTGAGGFIGRHVVAELVRRGHNVRVLHRGETFDGPVEPVLGDVAQASSLLEAMRGIEVVYHLAGYGAPNTPPEENHRLIETNVGGTLNVLNAAAEAGVRRVVLASSASVYGSLSSQSLQEHMTPEPISVYGISKLAAEHFGSMMHRTRGIEVVALRLFSVYGAGEMEGRDRSRLIPILLGRLQANEPVTVYGDGTQTRDFVHVSDVARAIISAGNAPGLVNEVINVGSGTPASVLDIVRVLREQVDSSSEIIYAPHRPGEIDHSVADIQLAERLLAYQPEVSLMEGLRRLVKQDAVLRV